MNISDLGPLERAILQALTIGDTLGVPLGLPGVWRLLPRYTTRLSNVREALAAGGALDGWVASRLGHYALRDRDALLEELGAAQGRGRELWDGMKAAVKGMCKLPWIEAVAVTGRPALGVVAPGEDDVRLIVIAEGGRVRLARWAIGAYRKARGDVGARIKVETIVDADALAKPAGTRYDALRWLTLRPVMNEAAFAALREANPWIHVEFPSAVLDTAGGLPDYEVDAGRFDGRLARVRRGLVGGNGESPEVTPLFLSNARIPGGLAGLEESLQSSLDGDGAECASRLGSDEFEAVFAPRWEAVEAWEVAGEAVAPLTPVDVEIEPVETPKRAKKKAASKKKTAPKKEAAPKKKAASKKSPRKSRAAPKRPSRKASAASSEGGRRSRGSGRK